MNRSELYLWYPAVPRWVVFILAGIFTWSAGTIMLSAAESASPAEKERYTTRPQHSPDGIGKFYMDREIAWVMGHRAADWLERPTRQREENTALLIQLLNVKPGDVVADIGAGSGYFTRRLAKLTAPEGKVLAVDIQPEMLTILTNKLKAEGISNVEPILGTEKDPKLPAGKVDLVLMVDVYHEFSFPYEMVKAISRSLKPGGRVAFVEYRMEDPSVPIKLLHKMSEAQLKKEMSVQPLEFLSNTDQLPWQHLVIFQKKKE